MELPAASKKARDPVAPLPTPPISAVREPQPREEKKTKPPPPAKHQLTSAPVVSRTLVNLTEPTSSPTVQPDSFVIRGGQYQLILVLDSRENFGMGKLKQILMPTLKRKRIACEVRLLPAGDFLWVAQQKAPDGRVLHEAVLDRVIERKKADDLASSMTSGHLEAQKSRLCNTGFKHCTLLFEKCPGMRHIKMSFTTMLQGLSNSEIIDGFDVVTSESGENTIELLAAYHRCLAERCREDLTVFRATDAIESPFHASDAQWSGLEWQVFCRVTQKSPDLTVKDLFARQLLQIHGMAGPSVEALLADYPTPRSLLLAYDACSAEAEKENLFVGTKTSKRAFGIPLSKAIHYVYNTF